MKVFIVEGNIGAGKSTFLTNIKKHNEDIIVVYEPVDEWYLTKDKDGIDIFSYFYSDPKKFAFLFQMNVLSSKLKTIQDACSKHPNSTIIFERSIMTDKNIFMATLFESGTISSMEYEIFESMYKSVYNLLNLKIDGIIYLQCEPFIAYNRILQRNRNGECVSESYLQLLHNQHEKWLLNNCEYSVTVIRSDATIDYNKLNDILS